MLNTSRRWDRMSLEEMRHFQIRRLRRFLATRVLPFSAHYRRTLGAAGFHPASLRRVEDLERIPFTTKADLLPTDQNPNSLKDLVLAPSAELIRSALPRAEFLKFAARRLVLGEAGLRRRLLAEYNPTMVLFTTGRSTGSIPFFLTLHDLDVLSVTGRRICEVVGLDPASDRVVSLFPYAPHLAFWQVAFCGFGTGILVLSTGGGRVMGAERIISAIEKMKPTSVVGMPGYFYHVLRQAREQKKDLSSIRKVALGGENVPAALKERIVEILAEMGSRDPKVVSVLGFTEARQCWAECTGAASTGFHTSPDLGLFEVIDPASGRVLRDGETGELVFTSLEGRGSAVLRYRTGDIVEGGISHAACPGCGRVVPRIAPNIQRVSNVKTLDITKVKGTLVNLNSLSALLSGDPAIEEWQIVLRKRNDDRFETDEVVLYAALRPLASPSEFRDRIVRSIAEATEIHLNDVVVTTLEELLDRIGMERNMKEERILDLRSRARSTPERTTG